MTVVLAFRHANGTSQCLLTIYRKPNDGGVSFPTCQQQYTSVSTYFLQSPMMEELAIQHANSVHLGFRLHPRESPITVELAFQHAKNGASPWTPTSYRWSSDG